MRKEHALQKHNWIKYMLLLAVVLVNVKNIFTSFDLDAEYSIAMSWRMVQGDGMFAQMWEPHQTSAFWNAILMYLYTGITGTTTGIVLYLNTMGVLMKFAVTYFLYRTLRKKVDSHILFAICLLFAVGNPKDLVLAEFSNMQIWFSVLLFGCLIRYLQQEKSSKLWLLAAGGFLCLEILAYPSCLIVFPVVLGILLKYSHSKAKDVGMLTIECALAGGGYLLYFILKIGPATLLSAIREIVSGDRFHGQGGLSDSLPMEDIRWFLMSTLIYLAIAVFVALLVRFGKWKQQQNWKWWFVYSFLGLYILQNFAGALLVKGEQFYLIIYIPILLLGWAYGKSCDTTERQIYWTGTWISLGGFVATLLLTNGTFFSSVSYLILGIMMAFIPLGNYLKHRENLLEKRAGYGMLVAFCLVFLFRCGYLINPMTEYYASILQVGGIVKSGPAMGIVSTYMGPYMMNSTMEEWEQYIEPGDRVLIVGSWEVGNLGYLYEDVEICVDSVISTPTYSEKLLRYWEQNPQKQPNVIAVECWYGDVRAEDDSWIMQWVTEEFRADTCVDGKYWRYYIKR